MSSTDVRKQAPSTHQDEQRDTKRGWIWFITGPTACGKTTIAKSLAESLGFTFVEGDDVGVLSLPFIIRFFSFPILPVKTQTRPCLFYKCSTQHPKYFCTRSFIKSFIDRSYPQHNRQRLRSSLLIPLSVPGFILIAFHSHLPSSLNPTGYYTPYTRLYPPYTS
jgi:hypothetical protein